MLISKPNIMLCAIEAEWRVLRNQTNVIGKNACCPYRARGVFETICIGEQYRLGGRK